MIAASNIYFTTKICLASPVLVVLMFATLDTYNVYNDLCFLISMSDTFNNHKSLLLL